MEQIENQAVLKEERNDPSDALDFSKHVQDAAAMPHNNPRDIPHTNIGPTLSKCTSHIGNEYCQQLLNSAKNSTKFNMEWKCQEPPHQVDQFQLPLREDKAPINNQTPEKIYECPYCAYKNNRSCNLANHLQMHYLAHPYADPSCNFCATLNNYKIEKMSLNNEGQMHPCNRCNYISQTVDNAVEHFKTHLNEATCICLQQRPNVFESGGHIENVEKQLLKKDTKAQKLFSCTQCSYVARRQQNLRRHLITHTGERPHSCNICKYRAPDMSSLRVHMKIHTGDRPHACPHCPYRASQKSTLRNHIKVHTGEKPYACTQCNYKSSNQTNLNSHIKTHTGEKPYSCPHCSYCATQSSALKCHLRTHTGEKPYECPHCPYRAAALGNLRSHLKVHANEIV